MLWKKLILALALGPGVLCTSYGGFIDSLADKLTESTTGPAAVEKRCHAGDASLCASAGNMYRYGSGVDKDMARAIGFYQLGCQAGQSGSCHSLYEIGFDDAYGKGVPVNDKRAVQVFSMACDGMARGKKYHGSACQELAKFYLEGIFVEKDVARAVELLRRGCEKPSRRACRDLGNLLIEGKDVAQDVAGAVKAFSRACEGKKKEPGACARLGVMLATGDRVPRDAKAAEQYLIGGCTFPERIGNACYQLARLYETDLSGSKTEEEITDLYHVACHRADSQRNGDACVAAANRHIEGKGAEMDAKKNANWINELYSRGCQIKHRESCRLSCELHCRGGYPDACEAVKSNNIPIGTTNCYRR